MRWPWQRADQPATDAPPRVPPAGWAFLPPLQRQLADAAPATLRPAFVSSLPTRSMPSSLGTMGHLVDDGAPAGTFGIDDAALGVPVQRAIASELSLRAPQPGAGIRTSPPSRPAQPLAHRAMLQRQPDAATGKRQPDAATGERVPDAPEPASPGGPAILDDAPPDLTRATADATPEPSVIHDSGSLPLPVHAQETIEPAVPASTEPTADLLGDAAGLSVSRLPERAAPPVSTGRLVQHDPPQASLAPVQRRVGLGAPLSPPTPGGRSAEVMPARGEATTPHVPALKVSRSADMSVREATADVPGSVSPTGAVQVPRSADAPEAPTGAVQVSRSADAPEVPTAGARNLPVIEAPGAQPATDPAPPDRNEEPRTSAAHQESPAETVPILMHSRVVEPLSALGSFDGATTPGGPHTEISRPTLQRTIAGVDDPPVAMRASEHADADDSAPLDRVDGSNPEELDVDVAIGGRIPAARSGPTSTDAGGTAGWPVAADAADAVVTDAATATRAAPNWPSTELSVDAGRSSPALALRSVPIVAARSIEPAIGPRPLGAEPTMARGGRVVVARVIAPGAPAHATAGGAAYATPAAPAHATQRSIVRADSGGSASPSRSGGPVPTTRARASAATQADAARTDQAIDLQRMLEPSFAASVTRSISAPSTPAAGVHAAGQPERAPGAPIVQRAFGLPSLPSAPRFLSTQRLPSVADLPATPGLPSASDLPSAPGLPSADEVRERAADAIPDLAEKVPGAADAVRSAASDTMTRAGQALSAAGGAASASSGPENVEQLVRKLYGPLVRRIKAELLLDRERRGIRIDGI